MRLIQVQCSLHNIVFSTAEPLYKEQSTIALAITTVYVETTLAGSLCRKIVKKLGSVQNIHDFNILKNIACLFLRRTETFSGVLSL